MSFVTGLETEAVTLPAGHGAQQRAFSGTSEGRFVGELLQLRADRRGALRHSYSEQSSSPLAQQVSQLTEIAAPTAKDDYAQMPAKVLPDGTQPIGQNGLHYTDKQVCVLPEDGKLSR